jgi:Flp pilus assembly protein TadG
MDRTGFSVFYVGLIFLILIAFVAFAVDVGRIRLGKAQLQTGADAGSRAGASGIPVSITAAKARAQQTANLNPLLHTTVSVDQTADLEFGFWDSKKRIFTVIKDDAKTVNDERDASNACHAYAVAQQARKTSIQLIFAPVYGATQSNLTTDAIAFVRADEEGFGFIGLDFITTTGTILVDSFNGAAGPYPGQANGNLNGNMASNGPITATGTVDIRGDARPGVRQGPPQITGGSIITGWQAPLEVPLDTATKYAVKIMPGADINTTGISPQTSLVPPKGKKPPSPFSTFEPKVATSVAAGVYRLGGIDMSKSGVNVTISGVVKMYVDGDIAIHGGNVKYANSSSRLELYVTKAGTSVDLTGNATVAFGIWAPLTDIKVAGNTEFYGYMLGKSLTFHGTSGLHYDESMGAALGPLQITLVK